MFRSVRRRRKDKRKRWPPFARRMLTLALCCFLDLPGVNMLAMPFVILMLLFTMSMVGSMRGVITRVEEEDPKELRRKGARRAERPLALQIKAKGEREARAVGVPDRTLLPGFVETSTALSAKAVDAGVVGVPDCSSPPSSAGTSTPPSWSTRSLAIGPTADMKWRVADVA